MKDRFARLGPGGVGGAAEQCMGGAAECSRAVGGVAGAVGDGGALHWCSRAEIFTKQRRT